jgi:hypothetical protein
MIKRKIAPVIKTAKRVVVAVVAQKKVAKLT